MKGKFEHPPVFQILMIHCNDECGIKNQWFDDILEKRSLVFQTLSLPFCFPKHF